MSLPNHESLRRAGFTFTIHSQFIWKCRSIITFRIVHEVRPRQSNLLYSCPCLCQWYYPSELHALSPRSLSLDKCQGYCNSTEKVNVCMKLPLHTDTGHINIIITQFLMSYFCEPLASSSHWESKPHPTSRTLLISAMKTTPTWPLAHYSSLMRYIWVRWTIFIFWQSCL